jgi:hypothetical protein
VRGRPHISHIISMSDAFDLPAPAPAFCAGEGWGEGAEIPCFNSGD